MIGESFWRKALAKGVVNICNDQHVRESDCELLVRTWLKDISVESRPTVTGVLAKAQREMWGLCSID